MIIEQKLRDIQTRAADIEAQMCAEENMNDYELLAKLSTRHEELAKKLGISPEASSE